MKLVGWDDFRDHPVINTLQAGVVSFNAMMGVVNVGTGEWPSAGMNIGCAVVLFGFWHLNLAQWRDWRNRREQMSESQKAMLEEIDNTMKGLGDLPKPPGWMLREVFENMLKGVEAQMERYDLEPHQRAELDQIHADVTQKLRKM